jgi:4-hydroxy-tetrahydrodipicolinate synthase
LRLWSRGTLTANVRWGYLEPCPRDLVKGNHRAGERIMPKDIKGIIAAVVTPFDKGEEIHEEAFRQVIEHLIQAGVHGLFPVGSQGEFYALDFQEKRRLMEVAVEQSAGRAFVMPNTGALTTRESVRLSQVAESVGADCVSVITPFFISPSQDELYEHFRAICQAVRIPVLAYNNPDRTGGVALSVQTLGRLAREMPNFLGVKDSSGDLTVVTEMLRLCPPGFKVIMGRDTLIFAALMHGAAGAIAATANVAPRLVVEIYEAFMAGDYHRARQCQMALAPLRMAFGLGTFPVVVKEALELMGIAPGRCRGPVLPLPDQARQRLRQILEDMGILGG